ncbi:hypothetical protein LZ31DRAFT_50524 [Colletotrichum somersetense]|nr:hypothetical protein LZ31DRAFT_50524 [Colletotrichum somersetense]
MQSLMQKFSLRHGLPGDSGRDVKGLWVPCSSSQAGAVGFMGRRSYLSKSEQTGRPLHRFPCLFIPPPIAFVNLRGRTPSALKTGDHQAQVMRRLTKHGFVCYRPLESLARWRQRILQEWIVGICASERSRSSGKGKEASLSDVRASLEEVLAIPPEQPDSLSSGRQPHYLGCVDA